MKLGKLGKFLKSNVFKSISTALGTAALLYVLLPVEIAIVKFSILLAHELAHIFMALKVDSHPSWPIFIPLGLFIIGLTRIKNIRVKDVGKVSMAGPVVGVIVAMLALLIGFVLHNTLIMIGATWALITEVLGFIFGADAKARRDAKTRMLGGILI